MLAAVAVQMNWFGVAIVMRHVLLDRANEIWDAAKRTAPDALASDLRKPALSPKGISTVIHLHETRCTNRRGAIEVARGCAIRSDKASFH
jgi:hypothetical protein